MIASIDIRIFSCRRRLINLNIRGRKALVCAASKGLGRACAEALAREGVAVTITGRDTDVLGGCAKQIEADTGSPVSIAPGDIATETGRAAALAVCPEPDILVTNGAGPPLGRFNDLGRDAWLAALEMNMLAPLALIPHWLNKVIHGCVIGVHARFGPGFVLIHPIGVVINSSVRGGSNIRLESGVVVGDNRGRFPVLEDDIFVGSGAKIIGGVRIGSGARIGANAVVLADVPPGALAVGIPARVTRADHGTPADSSPTAPD